MFSITTMASSTTNPKPSKKANSTIVFRVNSAPTAGPTMGINTKANRADSGTERPTKMASRMPIKNINTNTTKINPSTTVLIRSLSSARVRSDWSAVTVTVRPCGNRSPLYSSMVFSIRSAASIRLAPARLITFRVTTVLPLKRAKSCCSSNESRTSATSPKRIVAPVAVRICRFCND